MNRIDYVRDPAVCDFVDWFSPLLTGDRLLKHSWEGKGPAFQCQTIVEAFQKYRWPNSVNGETFAGTMETFDGFRSVFDEIGSIDTPSKKDRFVQNAREIVAWGGINNLRALDAWATMPLEELQRHVGVAKQSLNPATGVTNGFSGLKFMTSGFSKIYSALVPGFPIYDSRVACALACLVRIYCKRANLIEVPSNLEFRIPAHRGSRRCRQPAIRYYQTEKYAQTNLRAAWLLGLLIENPGKFSEVDAPYRLDALQSALFMIGYARLSDDSIAE